MERNAITRRMTPEEILNMFIEVQGKDASKSYDFPIANLLDQYMQSCIVPNFAQAAMLIDSAGHVYSRKVEHLECLFMAMNSKQNERTEQSDGTGNVEPPDKTEKKRPPTKRQKNLNLLPTTIDSAAPKQIKLIDPDDKMNLNSSDTSHSDRFKNFCQAVKSKTPVFYERINLLISDATDNCFDGARPISKEDPDCQKNYSVFVGCISFTEKQLMSQREFLNRIKFDNLNGCLDMSTALPQEHTDNNECIEHSSIIAGDSVMDCTENDMFESLRDASSQLNELQATINNTEECDSAMMDDSSQVNSTMEHSTINDSTNINSTAEPTNASTTNETIGNSTLFGAELVNSTMDVSNSNQIYSDSTCDGAASLSTSNLLTESGLISMSGELTTNSSCPNDSSQLTLNGTSISGTQIDPLTCNGSTNVNESISTICNNSEIEKSESSDDIRNIFRIDEEYLRICEVFRLPLNVLQQEVKINLNIFGIPFGRLRRQMKFNLPKDFDPSRLLNKRTKDSDDSSTIARKFVKLNDGTATPTVEITSTSEQTVGPDGNQPTVELTVTPLVPPSSDILPELVNGLTESHNDGIDFDEGIADRLSNCSQTLEDGPSLPKIPRLEMQGDAISRMDSGIGTLTEESVVDGTITNRRDTLDLTPINQNDTETEVDAEAEELAANRIQEMTDLAEKVSSWHKRLKPILSHSEKRNDFDVKDTCRNVVECFTDRDITFKDVMENRDKADTARFFFSMLQMANNKNIEIIVNHHDSATLCPTDQIKLKLLDPNIREVDPTIR